jgi:hypothetical protein
MIPGNFFITTGLCLSDFAKEGKYFVMVNVILFVGAAECTSPLFTMVLANFTHFRFIEFMNNIVENFLASIIYIILVF